MPAPHPNADPAYRTLASSSFSSSRCRQLTSLSLADHEPFKGEVPVGHHDRSIHYDPNASAENPVVISHTFENAAPSHQAVPGHYNPSHSTTSTSSSHNTGVPSTTHTHSHDYDRSTHSHPHPTGGQDETFTRDRLEHDTIPGAGTNANPASHGRHFNDANPGSEHVTPGSVVDGTSQSAAQKSRNTDHEHGENPASRAENSGAPGGFDYPEQKHAGKVRVFSSFFFAQPLLTLPLFLTVRQDLVPITASNIMSVLLTRSRRRFVVSSSLPPLSCPFLPSVLSLLSSPLSPLFFSPIPSPSRHHPRSPHPFLLLSYKPTLTPSLPPFLHLFLKQLSHDDPAHAQGRPANEAENHAGQETAFTRADDGANIGSHEGALPAKGTTASDVRESGHAASGSAGTAPGI